MCKSKINLLAGLNGILLFPFVMQIEIQEFWQLVSNPWFEFDHLNWQNVLLIKVNTF